MRHFVRLRFTRCIPFRVTGIKSHPPSHKRVCPHRNLIQRLNRLACVPEGESIPYTDTPKYQDSRVLHQKVIIEGVHGNEKQTPIVIHAHLPRSSLAGWFWSMVMVLLIAISTTSAACVAFIMHIRPVLKIFEETCKATEKTSKQLETTAIELEEAAIMFDEKLPPALKSVEAAGREFEELGQNMNSLSGGLISRRPSRHRRRDRENDLQKQHRQDTASTEPLAYDGTAWVAQENPKEISSNITKKTMDSIYKVASDLNTLTRSLGPAMDMWRRRVTNIVTTVEAEQNINENSESTLSSSVKALPDFISKKTNQAHAGGDLAKQDDVLKSSVIEGVGVEYEGSNSVNNVKEEEEDYEPLDAIKDILKDKDSLVARLAHESTDDAATLIMDALYKAEEAAEEAANASGLLQEAVERAKNSGAWDHEPNLEWKAEKEERIQNTNTDIEPL